MKKLLLLTISAAAFAVGTSHAQLIASDNAGNYSGGWTNGANGGFGFLAWSISAPQGTGFSGNFIGDPTAAGVSGMGTQAFGLYANPTNSGASVSVDRQFAAALNVGETFSFQWANNWDTGGGNKGFNLYTGGTGGTQLLNVNIGGFPGDVTFGGTNTGLTFGTGPSTWSFTLSAPTSLNVTATARDGSPSIAFSTNITIAGAPNAVRFYASEMSGADANNRQPYFNNLSVVPEPSTYALLALSAAGLAGYAARRRARK